MSTLRYAIDDLGWLEFEHLVQALLKERLGMGVEAWGGTGDWGRDAYFEGKLRYPSRSYSNGVFVFQCKFFQAANAAGASSDASVIQAVRAECERITKRLSAQRKLLRRVEPQWRKSPEHYVLLTNAPVSATLRSSIEQELRTVLSGSNIHVHSGRDLCSWLDSAPVVARRFPQLLGLRDLGVLLREYLHRDVSARSETALANARNVAKVFVPTAAYYRAINVLGDHSFVVLEGPPEMGKSAIGRMIALAHAAQGWEAIEIQRPEDFHHFHDRAAKQIFVADDFFGRTEYDAKRISSWQEELPFILPHLGNRCWLVLTSRAHLLNMAKKNLDVAGAGVSFPDLGEVVVDAGQLTRLEKARILYRHCKLARFEPVMVESIKQAAATAVHNAHFTPERIRRLTGEVLPALGAVGPVEVANAISESLSNPTKSMEVSFARLEPSQRWLLFALIEQDSSDNWFDDTEALEDRYRRLCPIEDREPFRQVLAEMSEAFIKKNNWRSGLESIDWIHPSCRDLAIDQLASSVRDRRWFLKKCNIDGIRLALSIGGGATGGRVFPLLEDPEDWQLVRSKLLEATAADQSSITWVKDTLDAAASNEIAPDLVRRIKEEIALPVIDRALAETQRVLDASPSELKALAELCVLSSSSPPLDALLQRFQDQVESLPMVSQLGEEDRYWENAEFRDVLDLQESLERFPGMNVEPRFRDLANRAARVVLNVSSYWIEEQVRPLSRLDDNFADAKRGCASLERLVVQAGAYVADDEEMAHTVDTYLAKIQSVVDEMEREPDEEDGADSDSSEPDESDVSISDLFRDL